MKKYLLTTILLAFILTGCSDKEKSITSLSMLEGGKTFAVPTGTIADQFVLKKFPDAKLKYFNTVLDCALEVKNGKADAAVYDLPILKNIAGKNDGLSVLKELLEDDQYGFAVQMQNKELKKTIDDVLAELKANGIYDEMMKRWFPEKGNPAAMPEIKIEGKNGILKFATAPVTEPMSFVDASHKTVGFDIEFAAYIAKKLDKQLEIVNMEFGAMLPALISGKVDMIGAGLSITEERAKKVLFSECYYPSGIAAIVRSNDEPVEETNSRMYGSVDDIKDKRIGVLLGSVHDRYATKTYPNAKILQYKSPSDILIALKADKCDAAMFDHVTLLDLLRNDKDFGVLGANLFYVPIACGFNKKSTELREQFNSFLKDIKANGIYDDMVKRWIEDGNIDMPAIQNPKTSGQLRLGTVSDIGMPFTIVKDRKIIGFDIELAERFAAYLKKELVPVDMEFGSLIAALSTNKIDFIAASMMITEERQKQIDFSDPYYESGVSMFALAKNIQQKEEGKLAVLDDIANKKVGVFTGTVHDGFVAKKYPKAQILHYESTADLILSVKSGKIDVAMLDALTSKIIMRSNPDLGMLTEDALTLPLGVGFSKNTPELKNNFNKFLKEIKSNGEYDKIYQRWFIDDAEKAVMPEIKNTGTGKKLVAAVSVEDLPYVAYMNGKYVGMDIELIQRFAQWGNYNLEFIQLEFPSLVAALASGKCDMISDGIAITEERSKQVAFSDTYSDFKTAVIALNKNLLIKNSFAKEDGEKTLWETIGESFYSNIILEKRYLLIVDGLKITGIISIFAALFGTIVGGLICFMRMSKRKIISGFAKAYISLLRGTPVLVLLMIIYYVVFSSVNISPAIVAVLAFGLNFGAYVSEMFRTSIESVDKGQTEAGIAGGFTKLQTFLYIVMPQALRQVLPVYKGEFISLVKMTSIVGYIAVQDLTKASDIIRSRTFDAFFPLIMAAVLYLVIAWLLTWALSYVEISVDPKRKRISAGVSK